MMMASGGDRPTEVTRERIDGLALVAARPARETGAPLLLIHGLFAASWMFERWTPFFAQRGRAAFALDLRGHGASDRVADRGRVSLNDHIDDVRRVAHGLGRVVLVSPAPPRGIPLVSLPLIARQIKYVPALLGSREIRVGRADADAIIFNRVPSDERPALYSRLEPDSGRAGREIMLGAVAVDERRVRCPVLVLSGDADRFVPLRVARRVAAKYAATLHVLPGRGHLVMREPGWAEAAGEVAGWVDSL
jgi:pimeloyl-ACP methyl ester carboxylesterase